MEARVLDLERAAEWQAALDRVDDADVYHSPAYHRAAEANGDGRALAFVAAEGSDLLVHPFLRRPIESVGDAAVDGGWCDLESVYGYSGPVATTCEPVFLERAWDAFDAWCAAERVVAEFVRFNPLLRNEELAAPSTGVVLDRETVALPLDVDDLWQSYPSAQRNMVRRAEAAGLVAVRAGADGLSSFVPLYREAMARVGAGEWYVFGDAYFDALAQLGGFELFEVRTQDGELVAAAIFLADGARLHYHLAASTHGRAERGANNLLLHAAASWGRESGLAMLHLGGGRTAAPDDALLRFKSALSRVRLPFYTGRRVHHREMYDDLCSLWLSRVRPADRPPFFLLYRLGTEA